MEDKLENLQALIESSGLGDVRQKVRGMLPEVRVLWVLDGYKVDGLPSGRGFFVEWDSLEHVRHQLRELADGGYDAGDDVAQMMNDLVPVDTAYSRMRKVRASLKFFRRDGGGRRYGDLPYLPACHDSRIPAGQGPQGIDLRRTARLGGGER